VSDQAEGWAIRRVGDVFDCWGGLTPSTSTKGYWGGKIPWVSSKDIKEWRVSSGTNFVTRRALSETRLKVCRPGSILIVVRSGILAHTLPVAIADAPLVVNQDLKVLDSGDDGLNEWLALHLIATEREILNRNRKEGTTVQSIRVDELLDLDLEIPPVAERRRIVDQVAQLRRQVDSGRDRLAAVRELTVRLRQSLLAAACSGRLTKDWRQKVKRARMSEARDAEEIELDESLPSLPAIPDSWTYARVGEVTEGLKYGSNAKALSELRNGVPMLRMSNVQEGQLDLSDLKYVRRNTAVLKEFGLRRGDILFNRTNSPELVGKAAVVDTNAEMVFASYLIRVRLKSRAVLPDYLCAWIGSPWGRHWARAVRTDGVSQSNINGTKLSQMPLPLAPLDEQREIVRRVKQIGVLIARIEQNAERAEALADSLGPAIIAKGFRAELTDTEASRARNRGGRYESADSFLARLKRPRVNTRMSR
jgi:type I restriction enzyme S subunit